METFPLQILRAVYILLSPFDRVLFLSFCVSILVAYILFIVWIIFRLRFNKSCDPQIEKTMLQFKRYFMVAIVASFCLFIIGLLLFFSSLSVPLMD